MKYIERPEYMQRLLDLMGTPDIKIITGVRRSGKSELMKAYIKRIRGRQPEANIIFVDFFDLKYEGLKEYHALYDLQGAILRSMFSRSVLRNSAATMQRNRTKQSSSMNM